jgi:hypothetical protein
MRQVPQWGIEDTVFCIFGLMLFAVTFFVSDELLITIVTFLKDWADPFFDYFDSEIHRSLPTN